MVAAPWYLPTAVGLAIGVQFLIAIACSIPAFVVYETGIETMLPIALLALDCRRTNGGFPPNHM